MKTLLNKLITVSIIIAFTIMAFVVGFSCRKKTEPTPEPEPTPTGNVDNFSSIQAFYNSYGVPMETFTLNAVTGGTFVSNKSTSISIPANAFVTMAYVGVTGTVAVNFKDIYSKADMLLSGACANSPTGPLESAGEFFISAQNASGMLIISPGKSIQVLQPVQPLAVANPSMQPFMAALDTAGNPGNWIMDSTSFLNSYPTNYLYTLYKFDTSPTNGTWCNSDNPSFFSAYPQTSLKLVCPTTFTTWTDVYLVFKNVNSMVHVYPDYPLTGSHTYSFAPLGLACTAVAVGVGTDGKLYSAFSAMTITATQTVNLNMTVTTATDFKNAVNALQ